MADMIDRRFTVSREEKTENDNQTEKPEEHEHVMHIFFSDGPFRQGALSGGMKEGPKLWFGRGSQKGQFGWLDSVFARALAKQDTSQFRLNHFLVLLYDLCDCLDDIGIDIIPSGQEGLDPDGENPSRQQRILCLLERSFDIDSIGHQLFHHIPIQSEEAKIRIFKRFADWLVRRHAGLEGGRDCAFAQELNGFLKGVRNGC